MDRIIFPWWRNWYKFVCSNCSIFNNRKLFFFIQQILFMCMVNEWNWNMHKSRGFFLSLKKILVKKKKVLQNILCAPHTCNYDRLKKNHWNLYFSSSWEFYNLVKTFDLWFLFFLYQYSRQRQRNALSQPSLKASMGILFIFKTFRTHKMPHLFSLLRTSWVIRIRLIIRTKRFDCNNKNVIVNVKFPYQRSL